MAKYYGKIGFTSTEDTGHGIYKPVTIEKDYYGDVNRRSFRISNGTGANDDLTVGNEISIVFDEYLSSNLERISYITLYGAKWKITSVEVNYPRLILTTGGLYNE